VHIQRAKAALHGAGTPASVGNQDLDSSNAYYNQTTQVNQTDALRQERHRIQGELETFSNQLLQSAARRCGWNRSNCPKIAQGAPEQGL
jgi:hypothetical protein